MKNARPSQILLAYTSWFLLAFSWLALVDNSLAIIYHKENLSLFPILPANLYMELGLAVIVFLTARGCRKILKIRIKRPLAKPAIIRIIIEASVFLFSSIGVVKSPTYQGYNEQVSVVYRLQINFALQIIFLVLLVLSTLSFIIKQRSSD